MIGRNHEYPIEVENLLPGVTARRDGVRRRIDDTLRAKLRTRNVTITTYCNSINTHTRTQRVSNVGPHMCSMDGEGEHLCRVFNPRTRSKLCASI